MADKARIKQYDRLALTLAKSVAISLKATLYFIGKPPYVILFSGALAVTFVCYITGHIVLTLFSFLRTLLLVLLKITNYLLATIHHQYLMYSKRLKPQVKTLTTVSRTLFQNTNYSLKKINTHIGDYFALLTLRLRFFWLRISAIQIPLPQIKIKYTILFMVLLTLIISPGVSGYLIVKDLPSPDNLLTRKIDVSTKIYDRNGVLLYKIYKDENRTLKRLEEIPEHVQKATLAAEDAEFYSHRGISLRGITRAIYKYIKEDEITGGSTITQQLIKNTLLTPEKTITRKIREVILAVWVENVYTKDQILEMYLNEVSYGAKHLSDGQVLPLGWVQRASNVLGF